EAGTSIFCFGFISVPRPWPSALVLPERFRDAARAQAVETLEMGREEPLDRLRHLDSGVAFCGPSRKRRDRLLAQADHHAARPLGKAKAPLTAAARTAEEPSANRMKEATLVERTPALEANRELGSVPQALAGLNLKPTHDQLETRDRRAAHGPQRLAGQIQKLWVARFAVGRALEELEHLCRDREAVWILPERREHLHDIGLG